MVELADKTFKGAITYLSKDLKEKIIVRSAQMGNASREMGNAIKTQL